MFVTLTMVSTLAVAQPAADVPKWSRDAIRPQQWNLYAGQQLVGAFRQDQDLYYPWQGAAYGDPTDPPLPIPKAAFLSPQQWEAVHGAKSKADGIVTGVVSERIRDWPAYSTNTGAITQAAAISRVGADPLKGDAGCIWVTPVGSEAARKAVADFVARHEAKDRIIVKGMYGRDAWEVEPQSFGELPAGDPVVLIQGAAKPDGKAFAYWLQTNGNLSHLATGISEGLRKADEKWRPKDVAGPGRPGPSPVAGDDLYWLVVAIVVVMFVIGVVALVMASSRPAEDEGF